MKRLLTTLLIGAIIATGGALSAYDKEDALKNWENTDVCNQRCEKAKDCISRKSDAGPNGRTACSEECFELCEESGFEKGEFD